MKYGSSVPRAGLTTVTFDASVHLRIVNVNLLRGLGNVKLDTHFILT